MKTTNLDDRDVEFLIDSVEKMKVEAQEKYDLAEQNQNRYGMRYNRGMKEAYDNCITMLKVELLG